MTKIEEAAQKYVDQRTWDDVCEKNNVLASFMDGANWQKEQFEKNRLSACDAQTKEEAQREMDFAMSIIIKEHRQPTYSDAIEYGMRVQKEQMMRDSTEYPLYTDGDFVTIDHDFSEDGYKSGDKVKVIIIKEAEK